MTKSVRIENADPGTTKKVVIERHNLGTDGVDVLHSVSELRSPTSQVTEYLTDSMFLVIREETIQEAAGT